MAIFEGHGRLDDGFGQHGSEAATAVVAGPDATLALPSAHFIADGHFTRAGGDLHIADGDGNVVVVQDYFAGDVRPDLVSPDGAQHLTPALVDSFLMPTAPGQYAQAAPGAAAVPIGQVLDLKGEAFAVHADGTRVQLGNGDPVFEGDVIETGGGDSAVRMVFSDKTEFSIGTDARLALDQLIFNPDNQSGEAQFSVLKGVFIFASGQIAKTDNTDMTVITPVATIGIRGTEVAGRVVEGDSQFTIIDGAIEVTTQAGSVTLDDRGETTQVAGNDTPPSEPVVLTPAQFGQAYGSVAGVASGYFDASQQGAPGGMPDGGSGDPAGSGDGSPDAPASGSEDRADAGTAPGGVMLASALPSGTENLTGVSDPASLAAAFAGDPTAGNSTPTSGLATGSLLPSDPGASISGAAGSVAGSGIPASTASAGILSPVQTATGTAADGGTTGGSQATGEETVVSAAPGLDLADHITFGGSGGAESSDGPSGFSLVPSDIGAGAPVSASGNADGTDGGTVQVAFVPVPGATADTGPAPAPGAAEGGASGSPPLDVPSTGSSGSPFRGESGAPDPFADNQYVAQPFGYAGPQLGDAVFTLVAGEPADPDPVDITVGDDAFDFGTVAAAASTATDTAAPASAPAESSDPADITLIVSNATRNQEFQDLTNSFELPDLGPDSAVVVTGAEMGIPGVGDSASITLERDGGGNVEAVLASSWDSVKNIRAESDTAAEIRIENFVHADVHFGDGGDSDITIVGAKRGFVATGDGDDTITIDAVSNGGAWSHTFDLSTGAGDDVVVFGGASDGRSALVFDGGAGTDTLRLTGPDQTFDLTKPQIQVTGVERIDISGTGGDATLTLPADLLDDLAGTVNPLTDTPQTLVVDGDAGDTLDLAGGDWVQVDTTEIDGQGYTVYQSDSSGMQVAADNDLSVV